MITGRNGWSKMNEWTILLIIESSSSSATDVCNGQGQATAILDLDSKKWNGIESDFKY